MRLGKRAAEAVLLLVCVSVLAGALLGAALLISHYVTGALASISDG